MHRVRGNAKPRYYISQLAIGNTLVPIITLPALLYFSNFVTQILLALFSTLGGAAALFLLLVPVGRVSIPYPDQLVMAMDCVNDTGELYALIVSAKRDEGNEQAWTRGSV